MFVCSKYEESDEQFQELLNIQEDLFSSLNLYLRIIDMPPHDLGSPAYRYITIKFRLYEICQKKKIIYIIGIH